MSELRHSVLALLAAALLAACSQRPSDDQSEEGPRVFEVTGIVRAPLEDGQVVIEHDDIPGFMPAMTMAFNVTNETDAARLRSGDRVTFRFTVGEKSAAGEFVITGRESVPAGVREAQSQSLARRLKPGDSLPEFTLANQDDEPFTTESLRDRFTVLTFIFTRCPVPEFCPAMAQRFSLLQGDITADPVLRDNARLLSISIDPEFDRPEVLREYGGAVGADFAFWTFATGSTREIDRLARAFAVFREHNGVTLDHTLTTALVNPDGEVVDLWRGNGWTVSEIEEALRAAIGQGQRNTSGPSAGKT